MHLVQQNLFLHLRSYFMTFMNQVMLEKINISTDFYSTHLTMHSKWYIPSVLRISVSSNSNTATKALYFEARLSHPYRRTARIDLTSGRIITFRRQTLGHVSRPWAHKCPLGTHCAPLVHRIIRMSLRYNLIAIFRTAYEFSVTLMVPNVVLHHLQHYSLLQLRLTLQLYKLYTITVLQLLSN